MGNLPEVDKSGTRLAAACLVQKRRRAAIPARTDVGSSVVRQRMAVWACHRLGWPGGLRRTPRSSCAWYSPQKGWSLSSLLHSPQNKVGIDLGTHRLVTCGRLGPHLWAGEHRGQQGQRCRGSQGSLRHRCKAQAFPLGSLMPLRWPVRPRRSTDWRTARATHRHSAPAWRPRCRQSWPARLDPGAGGPLAPSGCGRETPRRAARPAGVPARVASP
jgi:hypothetical protein